ncbi:MAG: endolytic transglycosylase MltG [Gemmatimonas sp.]
MRRAFKAVVLILAALTTLAAGLLVWLFVAFDARGPLPEERAVVIARGVSAEEIGKLLADRGVISNPLVFSLGVRLSGKGSALRSGEYAFAAGMSARAAMDLIVSGRTVVRRLTLPEGWTTAQALVLVEHAEGLEGPITIHPDEGALLPETYNYSWGDSRDAMVRRMARAMEETVADLWAKRPTDSPMTSPQEAVILASIVERETGVPDERGLVASVMVNRLKRGMRLQSDPTVAYGAAAAASAPGTLLARPLTRDDLQRATPYNTYVIAGLPPTPIANPGRAALRAAIDPPRTDFLYFVADGSGGHAFARTLDEHNRNVARWRAMERAREPAATR